NTDSAHLIG
nr:sperm activating peptide III [Clypeaster japonicus]